MQIGNNHGDKMGGRDTIDEPSKRARKTEEARYRLTEIDDAVHEVPELMETLPPRPSIFKLWYIGSNF